MDVPGNQDSVSVRRIRWSEAVPELRMAAALRCPAAMTMWLPALILALAAASFRGDVYGPTSDAALPEDSGEDEVSDRTAALLSGWSSLPSAPEMLVSDLCTLVFRGSEYRSEGWFRIAARFAGLLALTAVFTVLLCRSAFRRCVNPAVRFRSLYKDVLHLSVQCLPVVAGTLMLVFLLWIAGLLADAGAPTRMAAGGLNFAWILRVLLLFATGFASAVFFLGLPAVALDDQSGVDAFCRAVSYALSRPFRVLLLTVLTAGLTFTAQAAAFGILRVVAPIGSAGQVTAGETIVADTVATIVFASSLTVGYVLLRHEEDGTPLSEAGREL